MQFIDFHTHQHSSDEDVVSVYNVPLSESSSDISNEFVSIGIHPWEISDINYQFKQVELNVTKSNTIAIGECGLDKVKGPELSVQLHVFKKHIHLSEKYRKPLIVHCVKAYSEIIKLRKDIRPKQPWIFHGFNSSAETLVQALKEGFYFSFGPIVLNEASKAVKALQKAPLDNIFIETDNSGIDVKDVYYQVSNVKKVELRLLQKQLKFNFDTIFKF
nr:TatD family hydrolase [uncultured Carboxylicivirga sp.]